MSDRIYDNQEELASENLITIAQACHGYLAKQYFKDGSSKSYDLVKYFNLFEINIWSLDELYLWSQRLLQKPRCCFIRARIKDRTKWKHVLRRAKDNAYATLIPYKYNWFALDIDGYDVTMGDLRADAYRVLLGLGVRFQNVECFAVASASYGRKTGIHMRLFFWSQEPVSNHDVMNVLRGNKVKADLAIYQNPVQPIYTAAPVFEDGMIDPVKQRIVWIQGDYLSVNIPNGDPVGKGRPEERYTKQQADAQVAKYLSNVSRLDPGDRHTGLIRWCIPIGKLIAQGHFDHQDMIERALNHCSFWSGKRDPKKDLETITYAIDVGINSMEDAI